MNTRIYLYRHTISTECLVPRNNNNDRFFFYLFICHFSLSISTISRPFISIYFSLVNIITSCDAFFDQSLIVTVLCFVCFRFLSFSPDFNTQPNAHTLWFSDSLTRNKCKRMLLLLFFDYVDTTKLVSNNNSLVPVILHKLIGNGSFCKRKD